MTELDLERDGARQDGQGSVPKIADPPALEVVFGGLRLISFLSIFHEHRCIKLVVWYCAVLNIIIS